MNRMSWRASRRTSQSLYGLSSRTTRQDPYLSDGASIFADVNQNLAWFFSKAKGSFAHDGEVLFWTGVETPEEISEIATEFGKHGRSIFGDINLESKLQKAAQMAMNSGGAVQQARAYTTAARSSNVAKNFQDNVRAKRRMAGLSRRGYATTTNPNPPFGSKNASNPQPARVALIGESQLSQSFACRVAYLERCSRLHWASPD